MTLVLLYCWIIVGVVMLYGMDSSIVLLVIMMVVGNGIIGFICMELIFLVVLSGIWVASSTYERSGAISYLWFFSLVVSFGVIGCFDLDVVSFIILLVILANLPLVSLHIWLPKVHAEASILGSVFLAGLILKAGSVLFYLIGMQILYVLMPIVFLLVFASRLMDGKVIVAVSSVIHITMSVVIISIVWYVGWLHIMVSPLMFMAIYISYSESSSRLKWIMMSLVVLVNLSFPILGAFFGEIYFVSVLSIMPFLIIYIMVMLFTLNLYIRGTESNSIYFLIVVLLVLMI